MSDRINVILIGATGHIGSWVHRRLIEEGYNVTACSRKEVRLPLDMSKHTTWCRVDLSDMSSIKNAFNTKQHDFFIHLASEKVISNAENDPPQAIEVNVGGTARVLAAASASGVKRGVFASTWAVYKPNNIIGCKYKEDNELSPITVYGITKNIGEKLCQIYVRTGAIPGLSVLRLFNTVGGPAYVGAVEQFGFFNYVNKAIKNNDPVIIAGGSFPTPDGSCMRDFVDVRDVADMVVSMAGKDVKAEVFNIGSGVASSLIEVVEAFEQVSGKKIDHKITESRPGDPSYVCADIKKANKELAFKPRYTLEEMVKATIGI